MSRAKRAMLLALLTSGVAGMLLLHFSPRPDEQNIEGMVFDGASPAADALVGWQGIAERVATNRQGRFRLPANARDSRVIAHKPGFRIASTSGSDQPLILHLERLPSNDDAHYTWVEPHSCGKCHGDIYREWQPSAHARSATNPKFLHLFAGTDGGAPLQKTWNAQAEHPDGSAVCATCHAPTLKSPTLDYDVRQATGVAKSGVHCDYCHKIADAPIDKLGLRFGRDGLHLLRPTNGDLLSFGPLDDAVRKGESFGCLPLYKESRYCASCHEGIVFGVHAYGTYSEWLESPAQKAGKQCQDCHMAPTGKMTNIAPGMGGIERDPRTLASHHLPGGPELLRRSLTLKAQTKLVPPGRQVEVEVVAQQVGHRVPTGFADRQLILVVQAVDDKGRRVELLEGARLPPSAGKWQGLPGMLYAKQLFGEQGRTPLPFWLPITKVVDTRLVPEEPDRRTFAFAGTVSRVNVQVWYRRFWQEVADARRWSDNDLLVAERSLSCP